MLHCNRLIYRFKLNNHERGVNLNVGRKESKRDLNYSNPSKAKNASPISVKAFIINN